jgi:hypothetical protein
MVCHFEMGKKREDVNSYLQEGSWVSLILKFTWFYEIAYILWNINFPLFHLYFFVVDQTQLNRAKEATKSAVLMNLESRVVKLH